MLTNLTIAAVAVFVLIIIICALGLHYLRGLEDETLDEQAEMSSTDDYWSDIHDAVRMEDEVREGQQTLWETGQMPVVPPFVLKPARRTAPQPTLLPLAPAVDDRIYPVPTPLSSTPSTATVTTSASSSPATTSTAPATATTPPKPWWETTDPQTRLAVEGHVAAIQAIASSVAVPQVEEDTPADPEPAQDTLSTWQQVDTSQHRVIYDEAVPPEPEWPAPPLRSRWNNYEVTETSAGTWVHGEEEYTGQWSYDLDRADRPELYLDHDDYMAQFEDEMALWRTRQELEMAAWRAKNGVSNAG
jgi:hypothetical protein